MFKKFWSHDKQSRYYTILEDLHIYFAYFCIDWFGLQFLVRWWFGFVLWVFLLFGFGLGWVVFFPFFLSWFVLVGWLAGWLVICFPKKKHFWLSCQKLRGPKSLLFWKKVFEHLLYKYNRHCWVWKVILATEWYCLPLFPFSNHCVLFLLVVHINESLQIFWPRNHRKVNLLIQCCEHIYKPKYSIRLW